MLVVWIAMALSSPEWSAPPDCPDAADLARRVAALHGDLETPGTDVRGKIVATPGGHALDLEISTPTGDTHKHVEAVACDVLAQAAALMIAVALDPIDTAEFVAERTAPSPARPRPAEARTPERAASPTLGHAAAGPRMAVIRAGGSLGYAIVPGLEPRVQLGVGLRGPLVRVDIVGFHAFVRGVGSVRMRAWGASARVGVHARAGRFEAGIQLALDAAAIVATGFTSERHRTRTRPHLAAGVVPGGRWMLTERWALGLETELAFALDRPVFVLDPLDTLYRPPRFVVGVAAVIEGRFGGRDRHGPMRRPTRP